MVNGVVAPSNERRKAVELKVASVIDHLRI